MHSSEDAETEFKGNLKKWNTSIDEKNSDVYIKNVSYDSFREGKKSNKFDFVLLNWLPDVKPPTETDADKEFFDFYA